MDVGRPKKNDYPPYMTDDGDLGRWIVRNPITGAKKRFADEQQARAAALILGQWVTEQRNRKALDDGRPTISRLVDDWIRERLPHKAWDEGTRDAHVWKMERIQRELGTRLVFRTDRLQLEKWLGFCKTGDQFNKWRYELVMLWDYAVSQKLAEVNEAALVERRSTSKKLAVNRKVRRQLDVEGFRAIHEKAPGWMQIAMEQSLVTLQARTEICRMRVKEDYRDGYLFVIRDKVSGDSDMAFIKIKVTDELEDIRRRSLTLDGTASTYLVHRPPEKRKRVNMEGKPHWTFVNPSYLSHAFAEVRDRIERFAAMPARERPTFHEIRGLGARLLRARGVAESAIQSLMTHSNKRTTQIYLERGAEALTDNDYIAVTAPLKLGEVLRP